MKQLDRIERNTVILYWLIFSYANAILSYLNKSLFWLIFLGFAILGLYKIFKLIKE